jgi:hypothetical protein
MWAKIVAGVWWTSNLKHFKVIFMWKSFLSSYHKILVTYIQPNRLLNINQPMTTTKSLFSLSTGVQNKAKTKSWHENKSFKSYRDVQWSTFIQNNNCWQNNVQIFNWKQSLPILLVFAIVDTVEKKSLFGLLMAAFPYIYIYIYI